MQSDPTAIINKTFTEADRAAVIELARKDHRVREGELEIDDNAVVSFGSDNGAYVQAWLWVGFQGTSLDDEPDQGSDGAK